GGVAVGATATSFLFMLLLFLRMSTTGLTAQAYGAKNPQALARALVQPLLLALGAGALIALLRTPIIDLALHIVGGSEAVLEQARRFLEIRWLSAPASLANLVLLGWLLGVQYARAPQRILPCWPARALVLFTRWCLGVLPRTAWRRELMTLNRC
ncbi:MATE family efflux transporter, partial [Pseudomonas aeruginosa]|uniref:MATE family efflux transporter n=1 Tax=Pseudomonas aeruginosa TaxID=287 RepID=UPI0031B68EF4